MGVLTTAYRIEPKLLEKFLEDSNNLDVIIYPDELKPEVLGLKNDWKPRDYSFDKSWDDLLYVISEAGFSDLSYTMENDINPIEYKYSDIYVRYWDASTVGILNELISKTSEIILLEKCTDYGGDYPLEYVISGYDGFIKFVAEAADQGDIILIVTS